jgi:RNA polymerase sigma factor (sigma-70 family)
MKVAVVDRDVTVLHDSADHAAKLIATIRTELGMSQSAFGAMTGRCAESIRRYESRLSRPPAIFFHDLIEAAPECGLRFNDIAPALGFRRISSLDPEDYESIHGYFTGVRVLHGRSRMSFAAILSTPASHITAVEHGTKPEPELVQRLTRRFLHPHFTLTDMIRRFRTLRPGPQDLRFRSLFHQLHDPSTSDEERSRLRASLIDDNTELARRFASQEARRLTEPGDAANAWTIALVKAVDGHDPSLGDFVPYLRKRIFGEVRQEARRSWQSGTATDLHGNLTRLCQARSDLQQRLHREPTPAELATQLHLPLTMITGILQALRARHGQPLQNDLPKPATCASDNEISATTQRHLTLLDEPARRAVELRFIHDLDITEIAQHLDSSPAAVTDMINKALARLRSAMQGSSRVAP